MRVAACCSRQQWLFVVPQNALMPTAPAMAAIRAAVASTGNNLVGRIIPHDGLHLATAAREAAAVSGS